MRTCAILFHNLTSRCVWSPCVCERAIHIFHPKHTTMKPQWLPAERPVGATCCRKARSGQLPLLPQLPTDATAPPVLAEAARVPSPRVHHLKIQQPPHTVSLFIPRTSPLPLLRAFAPPPPDFLSSISGSHSSQSLDEITTQNWQTIIFDFS